MSYEIMYDRKFIKTTRGYLPMILSGSNNCTEFVWDNRGRTRERRERHWWCWTPRQLPTKDLPMKDYLAQIEAICREKTEPSQLFMRGGEWIMSSQWRKWFENGCKGAKTLEEYLGQNRRQSFQGVIIIWEGNDKREELREYLHTTEELESWLDRANVLAPTIVADDVFVCIRFTDNEPLKNSSPITGQVAIKHKNGGYLEKYEKNRSLSFTAEPERAIVFNSTAEAWEAIGNIWDNIRFVKPPACKPMRFVIRLTNGKSGYINRKTKTSLYSSYDVKNAKKFATKGEAVRYARKTAERFNIGAEIILVDIDEGTEERITL